MRRLVARLPVWAQEYPIDVLLAGLCLLGGAAAMFGWGPRQPLEALMPRWGAWLWAVCLLAGAACWLAGLAGIRERGGVLVARRLPVLRLGLWLLSMASAVYGVAWAAIGGTDGVLTVVTLLWVSALIGVRWVRLGRDAP